MSGSFSHAPMTDGQTSVVYPVALSLICHAVVIALFVISPTLRFDRPQPRSSISVSMVSMRTGSTNAGATAVAAKKSAAAEKPSPVKVPAPPQPAKTVAPPAPAAKAVPPKPLAATAPVKPKVSLKHRTFKSTQVVKQAIQDLEAKAEEKTPEKKAANEAATASPKQLQSALDRLRQSVSKAEAANPSAASGEGSGTSASGSTGKPGAALGPFNLDGDQAAGPVDIYSHLVAKQIEKNWAFNERVANIDRSLKTQIVFKVMPNGEIIDIFFTDRSGNAYLDESAYRAIVKSNPVSPHPPGLNLPYVQMGLRFTPQGVR
ncbi:hypothetical protein DESC_460048 [Desulfosarcina cetonica]|nr:hypothetical protein DESC_460048 [Desulfosarcina cetonica]